MSNMVINTNVMALNSHRAMKSVSDTQGKASTKLSTGLKINSAADDAAGLAISEKMRAQIRGLDMASKNAQDGISLIQTAEGALQEVDNMIQRVRELTVQASNDTNTDNATETLGTTGSAGTTIGGDRAKIQKEISSLVAEIGDTANRIKFNNRELLKGGLAGGINLQIGPNGATGNQLQVKVSINLSTIKGTLSLAKVTANMGHSAIKAKISTIDEELTKVTTARAQLGAFQNRLEYTIKSLDNASENISAAESRIRDTDMAKEMMNYTKANVLSQAATSMLAQANQSPQNVLQLLR